MNRGPYAGRAAPLRATTNGSMVGSGSSHQPSTLSRCGLPATALDERPSGRGSTLRRAIIASRICRARENAPIAEWKVPPEGMRAGADDAAHRDRPLRGQLLDRVVGAEVVRDRVEAAGVHDPGAGLLRRSAWCATYIRSTNSGSPVRST